MSALEIAARVRAREVSPVEVAREHLERIELLDPILRAFQVVLAEEALAEARRLESDPRLDQLPLAGVPVAIKDNFDVAGQPTRFGSLASSPAPAAADDELVRRLRAAGAVVIGKSALPELAIWSFTESDLNGVTRNPWNPERVPGGSTGGGAAAVAAGMAALALATDGGGSIRIPAAFCGLYGIKPGPGVVPLARGVRSHWLGLSAVGPIGQTLEDTALMLDVLSGTGVFATVRPPERQLRVALSVSSPAAGASPSDEIKAAVREAGARLASAGHAVVEADPPYPVAIGLSFISRWLAGIAEDVDGLAWDRLEPRTRQMARLGRRLHPDPRGAERWRARCAAWFADFDALLMPTVGRPAPAAGKWLGRGFLATLAPTLPVASYTGAWNLAAFPAMAVPAGLDRAGMPLSVQLVAPDGGERLLLSLAPQAAKGNLSPNLEGILRPDRIGAVGAKGGTS